MEENQIIAAPEVPVVAPVEVNTGVESSSFIDNFKSRFGVDVPDGYEFTICNFNAYNINLADVSGGGTNNINVQGSTAILEPGESLLFVAYGGVCYAIGREVA